MTRTRRIYNKKPIEGGPGFKGWMTSEIRKEILNENPSKFYNESLRPGDDYNGISRCLWVTYHPYAQLCCGNCLRCKDRRLRSRRRQTWKSEERSLAQEYFDWSDFPYDFVDRDCTYDPLAGLVDIYYDYIDWLDEHDPY